jgi:glycosyltransferase involved in cell wall biosynthesis
MHQEPSSLPTIREGAGSSPRRVLFFGTYNRRLQQRVGVLKEGFEALGDEVLECNVPLVLGNAMRVRILRQPWLIPLLAAALASAWWQLWRRTRHVGHVDLVVVGYMGHFDVHLARRLWPDVPIVLDHMISAEDTARDRGVTSGPILSLLRALDNAALRAADVPCVDTIENLERLPEVARRRAAVVPVGALDEWFRAPRRNGGDRLRVVFFGSFAPLQGGPIIGEAVRLLHAESSPISFTVVGRGQDYQQTRSAAGEAPVEWIEWVETDELPELVASHDVCLGIFGAGVKALRVVPTKVFQGAAAGLVIVTSDTAPQRAALGPAAVYVPPGDARALADALRDLATDRSRVASLKEAARLRALGSFSPGAVVAALQEREIARQHV